MTTRSTVTKLSSFATFTTAEGRVVHNCYNVNQPTKLQMVLKKRTYGSFTDLVHKGSDFGPFLLKVLNTDFAVQKDEIVTDFCPYGTLYSLTEVDFTSCGEMWGLTDMILTVTQIFRCIAFFHSAKRSGYGFLSPGNFWITSGFLPLLSCVTMPHEAVDLSNASLMYWMAPETIECICEARPAGYDKQLCDVYSAGLIALEFLTTGCNTQHPQTILKNHALHIDEFDIIHRNRIANLSLPEAVHGPMRLKHEFLDQMRSLLGACCQRDPAKRPQARYVVMQLDAALARWSAENLINTRKWQKYQRTVMRAILNRKMKEQDVSSLMKAIHTGLLFPLSTAILYFEISRQPPPTGVLRRLIQRLTEEATRLRKLSATKRISHVPTLALIQRIVTIYPKCRELSSFCQEAQSLLM